MARTAIITGAAQGIGAAIARRLAKDGMNIAVNCINQEQVDAQGNQLCEELRGYGVEAECYIADVSDFEQCGKMVDAVKERFGTIDCLVNNAGITRDGLLVRMSEEAYDSVIAVNQKSVYNMMKHVSAVMIKQRSGKVVSLSSVAGVHGNPGQFNYSASKAAIIGMTMSAAKELGSRGINVNAVAPGFIETPMTAKLTEEQQKNILSAVAMKRYGKAEEVANVVSFLLSDDASYVTGQVIEISGGLSM